MAAGGSSRRSASRPAPPAESGSRVAARGAWCVLGALLAALLVAAATFDPRLWPSPVGDESTYLMAAQSLAFDGDLRYELADLDRFRALRGGDPDGLILQSADGGATLLYAKPVWYPLYLAPFVRVLGLRGPALANALLLIVAAVAVARSLRASVADAAPLWAAALLFASVAFAHVFWVHADLFQMCLTALALAAVTSDDGGRVEWRRFGAAGLLLGGTIALRPVYATLAVALALATAGWRRSVALLGGVAAVAVLTVSIDYASRGAWTSYGAERQGYYGYTGFAGEPGAPTWAAGLAGRGASSWVDGDVMPSQLDLALQARNAMYFLLGRHVGLLPYFLPVALGLAAARKTRLTWLSLAAVVATTVAFSLLRPYNFWGGGGSLANRYFLPLYPAFWFLPCVIASRRDAGRGEAPLVAAAPLPGVLSWALPVVVAALAAPAMWPLWQAPRQFLRGDDGGYGYVAPAVQRLLPYETSQKHLKPSGREDFVLTVGGGVGALWAKPLSARVRPLGDHGGPVVALEVVAAGAPAEVLLGSPQPLAAIELEGSGAGEVETAGHWRTRLELRPTAAHSMWWTAEPFFLYRIDLEQVALRSGNAPGAAWTVRLLQADPSTDR